MPEQSISLPETWQVVPGFSKYKMSNLGRIMRAVPGPATQAGRILHPRADKDGYMRVAIPNDDGKLKLAPIHVLVALAFHGPRPTATHEAAHGDGDLANNTAGNIRWATKSSNWSDRFKHGTDTSGSRHSCSKLTEAQVRTIRAETDLPRHRSHRLIGIDFGVSGSLISHIANRISWKHVP